MLTLWEGYSFATGSLTRGTGLLDQLESATGPSHSNGRWTVSALSGTEIVLDYRGSDYRFGRSVEVTIKGEGFFFTHYYTGQPFVPGSILGGTVTSMVLSGSHGTGSPAGGAGTRGEVALWLPSLSITDLLANGLDNSGHDYIVGGIGESYVASIATGWVPRYSDVTRQGLHGGPGFDIILGMDGDDWIDGGADIDYLDGGKGIDTLSVLSSTHGEWIHLGEGTSSTGDVFVNFENLNGSPFGDVLAG